MIETLQEVAEKYEASVSQVALNWLIHFQGETVVAIPGASKVQHAEQSSALMKFKLMDGGNEFIIQPGGKDHFIPLLVRSMKEYRNVKSSE